ncbi:uncharacterized protein BXZ73DRAFT_100821 [Epithele typhae]|uniref:uncharacterized protein n=1 Tax=Epithele typhae TaxID=378194 RepID=UPI0020077A46|nr:uncharacterized protein BXZ73DRAFT_100821 [Epithele typhae]KAH9933983.1 hypothetical protein BXZ73DRAFT_100821 [Epithele typhae]
MSQQTSLHIALDSGAPAGSTDFTTLVMIHGYNCPGGMFAKLVPLAHKHNSRVVFVNRRDYPGAKPYDAAELAVLKEAAAVVSADPAKAHSLLAPFMKERAREVFDLLAHIVEEGNITLPQKEKNTGGIIVGGWSFGTAWMTALLAHVADFSAGSPVAVDAYVRRVILHDGSYPILGYPSPDSPDNYNPTLDPAFFDLSTDPTVALRWVSGYFAHGDTEATLQKRVPLDTPTPTLLTLTPEETASALCVTPGLPGGSDQLLFNTGVDCGLFTALREAALATPSDARGWPAVEVRYVWCEASVWEMVWCAWSIRKEMEEKVAGMREVRILRLPKANHFVHWDEPERSLKVFLAGEDVSEM